jgi:predicted RNA polymerase sigma factor
VSETDRAIDAVWRIESPRLIAALARKVGDIGLAEDLAQDALVAAPLPAPDSPPTGAQRIAVERSASPGAPFSCGCRDGSRRR